MEVWLREHRLHALIAAVGISTAIWGVIAGTAIALLF
jgi:hypothetical protein